MMFLKKLDFLISEKGINKSILSKESGIPYTTIDGFYKKGYDNIKLSTLKKLCKYFGVSLDFLINEEYNGIPSLTEHEKELVLLYRKQKSMQQAVDKILGLSQDSL